MNLIGLTEITWTDEGHTKHAQKNIGFLSSSATSLSDNVIILPDVCLRQYGTAEALVRDHLGNSKKWSSLELVAYKNNELS